MSLIKAHNLMSLIEKEIYEKYEIVLVIHVEPVGGNFTEREIELKEITENWKNQFSYIKSMHDFAIYKQGNKYFVGLQLALDGNKLDKNFDFIFIDAAKGQYKKFFEDSYKLLNEGGIVFIDNILFRGYLYKESPKRFKTIVKRLDEFINYLYENFDFVLLPISDGVGLVYKK